MGDVTERPQPFIGEAEIVAFLFFLREPDAPQRVFGIVGRHADTVPTVDDLLIRVAGAMGDPRAVTGTQNRFERSDQAARGHEGGDRLAAMHMLVRLPVRDDEQARPLEPVLNVHAQPLRRSSAAVASGSQVEPLPRRPPAPKTRLCAGSSAGLEGDRREETAVTGRGKPGRTARAQIPHPPRGLGDRTKDGQLNAAERGERDEDDRRRHVPQRAPPEPDALHREATWHHRGRWSRMAAVVWSRCNGVVAT